MPYCDGYACVRPVVVLLLRLPRGLLVGGKPRDEPRLAGEQLALHCDRPAGFLIGSFVGDGLSRSFLLGV